MAVFGWFWRVTVFGNRKGVPPEKRKGPVSRVTEPGLVSEWGFKPASLAAGIEGYGGGELDHLHDCPHEQHEFEKQRLRNMKRVLNVSDYFTESMHDVTRASQSVRTQRVRR